MSKRPRLSQVGCLEIVALEIQKKPILSFKLPKSSLKKAYFP